MVIYPGGLLSGAGNPAPASIVAITAFAAIATIAPFGAMTLPHHQLHEGSPG
jgi:hypothetical protein